MAAPAPVTGPFDRMLAALESGGQKGLAEALARIGQAASQAAGPFLKLAQAMDDPRARKAAGAALHARQETDRLNATVRARLDLEVRRHAVLTGSYSRDLRAQQVIRREQERIYELERRAQYQERFGRLGGAAYQADRLSRSRAGQMIAAGGAALGATVGGMARSGFSGTVEGNRLNLELEMISRELAGAFKPAIEAVTMALGGMRKWLERLGPAGQNAVALGGLGLGAYGTYKFAGAGMRMLGLGGAGGAGAVAGGGGLATGLGVGLGAAGAARVGGLGGLGGAGTAGAAGVAGAGGAAAGAAGAGAAAASPGLLRRAARFAGRVALPLAAGAEAASEITDSDGFYEMERRRGTSRLGSGLASVGHGFMNMVTFGGHADRLRERGLLAAREPGGPGRPREAPAGPNPERRAVTLADAGFESPGAAFERITNRLAVVTAPGGETEAGGGGGDMLPRIYDLLTDAFRRLTGAPPPVLPGR